MENFAMMHRKSLIRCAAFASGIFVIAGFRGVDSNLGIYDANNKFVGQPQYTDVMYKQYGTWYAEGWTPAKGLGLDALFLHTSLNCADKAPYDWYYGDEQVGPPIVRFDGTNVWASTPGSQKQINVQSYFYAGTNTCYNYSYTTYATVPKLIGTPVYTAPFAVR